MIEDAERAGLLKPGGTIIEGTSGNTGMGLAIAAVVKGYKCIFTTTDKQSKEKIDALQAFGAEVIVCPTNVDPEDPALLLLGVVAARARGPELLEGQPVRQPLEHRGALRADGPRDLGADRRGGDAPRLGVGTGGTISGVGRYLKERNPRIKVWGIDTYGSVFKKFKETGIFDKNEIYPYITEGIGEDFLPANVDFDVIDHFEKVTDKDAAIMTRRITREEGIFAGNSAGSAMAGLLQLRDNFTQGRRGRRDLSRPRVALPREDVQRRVDAGEGVPRGQWHDRARSGGAGRVGGALRARGGAAGRRGDPGHERPRLLADLRDPRRPRRRLAQ